MAGRSGGTWVRGACAGLLLAAAGTATAGDVAPAPVGLLAPIRFAEQAAAKGAVRDNCELEKTLQDDLLAALRARGRSVDAVASTDSGKVLEVVIQRVEAAGSHWTGPKMLSVTARLYQDGRSAHLKMLTASGHGGINIFASNCQILRSDSSDVATQAARWLDDVDRADATRAASATAAAR